MHCHPLRPATLVEVVRVNNSSSHSLFRLHLTSDLTTDNPTSAWIEGAPPRPSLHIPPPLPTSPGHSSIPVPPIISIRPHPPGMDAGHDSLVTVRLSEPPILTVDTELAEANEPQTLRPATIMSPNDSSLVGTPGTDVTAETATPRDSLLPPQAADASRSLEQELGAAEDDESRQSLSSEDQDEVNWEQLEKTEDEQTKDEETDNVSTCLALGRLGPTC